MAGRGSGRGNLLDMMRKKNEEQHKAREEEQRRQELEKLQREIEAKKTETTNVSSGRGRGNLLEKLKRTGAYSDSSPLASTTTLQTSQVASTKASQITASSSSNLTGQGRGNILSAFKKMSVVDTIQAPSSSGDLSGVTGRLGSITLEETKTSITSEPEVVSRQGVSGKPVVLTTNYVTLKVDESKGMYQYEVKFSPDIDSRSLRSRLLNQHLNELGNVKTFDGVLLYLPVQLDEERTVFESIHPTDQSTVTLTVIFKKKMAMKENISFFNTLMNRVLKALSLVRIGRHDFNPSCAHKIHQHRLEVWPGYITAINELEGGLKLNLDAAHRVMRLDTVRDLMTDMYGKDRANFKRNISMEVIGTSVLTRYNNRTYRVDDIDWEASPMTTFERKGVEITLVDYYKQHHGIKIQDFDQPLLITRSKEKKSTGETVEKLSLLVPELCYLAGLTDSIRKDFKITKDLATVTKVNPEQRKEVIKNFIKEVNSNEVTRKILSDWGLTLEDDTVQLKGRLLDPEELKFGNEYKIKSTNADWGKAATNSAVLRTPNMQYWSIICPRRNDKNARDFLETFKKVCERVKIRIGDPVIIFLRDDNSNTYVQELQKLLNNNGSGTMEMVVIIFPSLRQDKYTAVKRICCIDFPVPSQVIISKTISRPDKIKSVTEKIALQINCKLGGALWALQNPFKNSMVCGIDVYHGGPDQRSGGSVAGFVASLDTLLTSWHSRVCMQQHHQELIDLLKQCLISALKVYREKNDQYPDRIFIYRDGVGDGELDVVKNYEVKQFLETCSMLDPNYKPKLTVVIVQKRVNTRIFEIARGQQLSNPAPGTIVDSVITRRYLYDFYLVPQLVKQGTVTPTHYVVLYDSSGSKTDYIQRFTYKLCHLYYNWPGTIRVPAPCQYAHKLAYLVGQSLKTEPSQHLNNLLYYL
ncbi:piwi-like protein Ago3 [Phymastichus coffea]|uniref:piwi-like protein Ago3 n=1 Tax=Phymastichus coffea TaxID=108790 RepID=UPI00273BE37F|nr:piwi-like protein Ago3 [Phymastichus coffea]